MQGKRSDLRALLAQGWYSSKFDYDEALVTLLEWMRRYNQTTDDPIHIAGFDFKQPALALEAAERFARRASARSGRDLTTLAREALRPGAFGLFPNVSGWTGTVSVPLPERDKPAPVRLTVGVRAEGLEYGSAGVLVSWRDRRVKLLDLGSGELGAEWEAKHLDFEAPSGSGMLDVALYHRGNGTVWFDVPVLSWGEDSSSRSIALDGIEVRPRMMPKLQVMDYHHELVLEKARGHRALRVTADPALDRSLQAIARLEQLMEQVLESREGTLSEAEEAWARQDVRLAAQAVHWRTLLETNRDVFLAENLHWLADVAFSGRKVLAVGHTVHAERRPGRMGTFLNEALGEGYRVISMIAGAGSYRYFGEVGSLGPDPPLEEHVIDRQDPRNPAAAAYRRPDLGSYLLPLRAAAESRSTRPNDGSTASPSEPAADILIYLESVEPMREPTLHRTQPSPQ